VLNTYAVPQGFLEVWPFEGGPYYIQGQQLLAVTTNKNIREDMGQFSIELAPGGPLGPNKGPTWVEIITPMSFVLIGLARGTRRQIVMVGVATLINETEEWPVSGGNQDSVLRKTVITGLDFGRFFTMVNWLALFFLGGIFAPSGEGIGSETTLGAYDFGLLKGRPDEIATKWFTEIMQTTMSKTYVSYHNQQITFPRFMAYWFEQYTDTTIPMSDYYIASEGNWIEKFRQILQFPWYEFFVITAPANFFTNATGGYTFTMQMMGQQVTARTYAIGRVNPLPWVPAMVGNMSGGALGGTDIQNTFSPGSSTSTGGGALGGTDIQNTFSPGSSTTTSSQTITYGSVDVSKWNQLPLFTADSSFIKSEVVFNDAEVRNFYIVNPQIMLQLWGQNNTTLLSPFLFQNSGAEDLASIVRYGYRPEVVTSRWFADPQGTWAQQGDVNVYNIVGQLTARLTSYYEPTPLMAKARATFPLLPDVIPGFRFRYRPGKGEPLWDYYIEGITHKYQFSGPSVSELTLARGLPTSVYSNTDLLKQMHLGNAQRMNGVYQTGLPAGSLSPLMPVTAENKGILAQLTGADKAFRTPKMP